MVHITLRELSHPQNILHIFLPVDGDAHDCRKQPANGVHHAEEILPSPLTAKPLWQ
jgi:hypothetical protein